MILKPYQVELDAAVVQERKRIGTALRNRLADAARPVRYSSSGVATNVAVLYPSDLTMIIERLIAGLPIEE